MSNSDVLPLLNVDKLTRAAVFAEMIDMAVEHALAAKDYGYVNRVLAVLSQTKYERTLAVWFCSRLGLRITERQGRLHLVDDSSVAKAWHPLATIFQTAVAARNAQHERRVLEQRLADPRLRVIVVPDQPYIDMLDAKARLPGNFETRRRR